MNHDLPPSETTLLIRSESVVRRRETISSQALWKLGALYGAAAVALGAFGAHGLKDHVSDPHKLANWATAAHYQVRMASEMVTSVS
jgi:hypothetical protein